MDVGGQRHAPATLHPGKCPIPIVQQAGWAPELVWTDMGRESLLPQPGFEARTVEPIASSFIHLWRMEYYPRMMKFRGYVKICFELRLQ
jgi:hypothetical protein